MAGSDSPARAAPGQNTILHIGLGSFHRAHQAVYLNALRERGDTAWSIVGGNLRDDMADTVAALIDQDGEYTLETVSPAGERRYERVRSIREVLPFNSQLTRLIDIGAEAGTRIISCTVTEAGYYLDSKHRLDPQHADLAGGHGTIYGALTLILRERLRRGGAPVTLLNCDNLRSNGTRLRDGLLEFLQRRGETDLAAWVREHTSSPCNMVDRITPRPPPDLPARVLAATGWADRAPVMGESFIQWVIEDNFIAGRPAWETVGAEMVSSVHAHEEAKIRILNATHSCVAWAGTLKGLGFIHEDMRVPAIRQMAWDYVTHDVMPCLDTPEHPSPIDLARYRDVVLERFGNPHVRDTNARVAMDGFSKLPGFIVPTLRECLQRGASGHSTAMLPALLFSFLERWHRGEQTDYRDGVMDPAVAHAYFNAPDPLAAFAADPLLWGGLASDPRLISALRSAHAKVQAFLQRPLA
jgi:D-arabinitol 4-dehydrogenase